MDIRLTAKLQAYAKVTLPNVIDNLESDSTKDCLSANQGKVLKELIDNSLCASDGHMFKFEVDEQGNYGFMGANGVFIPFVQPNPNEPNELS